MLVVSFWICVTCASKIKTNPRQPAGETACLTIRLRGHAGALRKFRLLALHISVSLTHLEGVNHGEDATEPPEEINEQHLRPCRKGARPTPSVSRDVWYGLGGKDAGRAGMPRKIKRDQALLRTAHHAEDGFEAAEG